MKPCVRNSSASTPYTTAFATCLFSLNEGKTWEGELLLDERECSYPFGGQANNGTIYVSYERSRWRQPEILFARFTEADVLAGTPVSPLAALQQLVNRAGRGRAVAATSDRSCDYNETRRIT